SVVLVHDCASLGWASDVCAPREGTNVEKSRIATVNRASLIRGGHCMVDSRRSLLINFPPLNHRCLANIRPLDRPPVLIATPDYDSQKRIRTIILRVGAISIVPQTSPKFGTERTLLKNVPIQLLKITAGDRL